MRLNRFFPSPYLTTGAVGVATLVFLTMTAPAAHAKGFFEPLSRAVGQVGRGVGKGVSQVGKEVGKGVKNTGREVGRGARNVERFGRRAKNNFAESFQGRQPANPVRLTVSRLFTDSLSINRGAGSLGSFTLDYDARLNNLLGGPTAIGVFADLSSGSRYARNNSADFDVTQIGLGIYWRRVFTRDLNRNHFYTGVGAGFYRTEYTVDPLGPERFEKTDFSGAIRLLGGYQFTKNLYAQLDIIAMDRFQTRNSNGARIGVNPSGARFGIGYRF